MKTSLISVVVLISFYLTSCVYTTSFRNELVVKKSRQIASFTSVTVESGWDLILTQGDSCSMIVEADQQVIDNLVTEVADGELRIKSENNDNGFKTKRIYLTFKELKKIKASGGSDVIADSIFKTEDLEVHLSGGSDLKIMVLKADDFKGRMSGGSDAYITFENVNNISVESSGGSDIKLKHVNADKAEISLSGGSDLVLQGSMESIKLNASGGSDVNAADCTIKDAKMNFSGASDGKIMVTGNLDIKVSSASDVSCTGDPKISKREVDNSSSLKTR
jgi:hypothetical protein